MRVIRRSLPGLALMVAGLLLMTVGVFRGEVSTVLTKAVYLCLECIGIG